MQRFLNPPRASKSLSFRAYPPVASHVVANPWPSHPYGRRPVWNHHYWNRGWNRLASCRYPDGWRLPNWRRSHGHRRAFPYRLARQCPPVPKPPLVLEHVARPRAPFLRARPRPSHFRCPHGGDGALQRRHTTRPCRPAHVPSVLASGTRNRGPKGGIKPVVIASPSPPPHAHLYHEIKRYSVLRNSPPSLPRGNRSTMPRGDSIVREDARRLQTAGVCPDDGPVSVPVCRASLRPDSGGSGVALAPVGLHGSG
jgi:hypothetical protein